MTHEFTNEQRGEDAELRAGDGMDRRVLATLIDKFNGGPVGLQTLAVAIGEEPDTLADVYEPYLIAEGLLDRTPRGRVATALAYAHLGRPYVPGESVAADHGGDPGVPPRIQERLL